MFENLHIAVLGGDNRYIHVIHQLAHKGTTITAVGYSENMFEDENITSTSIENVPFESVDALLLPVAGMDQHGIIQSNYTDETFTLTAKMLHRTRTTCAVFTGTANNHLRTLTKTADRELIVLFERDDIAIANSIPTAEATLQIAMEETTKTIHNTNVLIIGYGRVGKTLAHLFDQVGANVTVAARKDSDLAHISALTYHAVAIKKLRQNLVKQSIIINTVPALILDEAELTDVAKDSLIIDLASKPGGINFTAADQLGIKTIHALGLPGKVAPETAGNIIGNVLTTLLQRKLGTE